MRVLIDIEVEIEDYSGEEFKKEVEELIFSVDRIAKLVSFKMRSKDKGVLKNGK